MSSLGVSTIENSATIRALGGLGIELDSGFGALRLTNSGSIEGSANFTFFVTASNSADSVTNSGSSSGGVALCGADCCDVTSAAGAPITALFLAVHETGNDAATRDAINGFVQGDDVIDLSAIDAVAGGTGNEQFSFLGTGAFTNTAGQLRYALAGANLVISGDVNGDGISDFQIQVNILGSLTAADFLL